MRGEVSLDYVEFAAFWRWIQTNTINKRMESVVIIILWSISMNSSEIFLAY